MKQVAEQTGGEAFVGTNDLKRAMQRSMDDGSTYYTLAYTPDKIDPETAFHRIEVKVDHPDVKLAYRRGYYSSPAESRQSPRRRCRPARRSAARHAAVDDAVLHRTGTASGRRRTKTFASSTS